MKKVRSSDHIKAQKDGKERDLKTCQICGSTERVEGHHIYDVKSGGSPHIDNIITLCYKHHKDVHRGEIDITAF